MSETRKIRVLIVDDHPLMRVGVAAIIDGQATMMTVAQASTGEEAIELYEQHRPDITLIGSSPATDERGGGDSHHPAATSPGAIRCVNDLRGRRGYSSGA